MTTKSITTFIAAGYTLAAKYSEVIISSTGGLGGVGLIANAAATVLNSGRIEGAQHVASYGVVLNAGGGVVNDGTGFIGAYAGISMAEGYVKNYGTIETGASFPIIFSNFHGTGDGVVINGSYLYPHALISGPEIVVDGTATITNFGAIQAGIRGFNGGRLTNGGVGDATAFIGGPVYLQVGAASVTNFGTIAASGTTGGVGLSIGSVTNGAATDKTARITGGFGVFVGGPGTVVNFGDIIGVGTIHTDAGVNLDEGSVINGTAVDQSAVIEGYSGLLVTGAGASVVNYGTIIGDGANDNERGVDLLGGGRLTNGRSADPAALIEGANGVVLEATGTVANYGAILGLSAYGVRLKATGSVGNYGTIRAGEEGLRFEAGGSLTNGAPTDRSALIEAPEGVVAFGGAFSLVNGGTIRGTAPDQFGTRMIMSGGRVVNGSLNNSDALIEGYGGLYISGAGAATNFGLIRGLGDLGYGAQLYGAVDLTNGAAGHAGAVVEGYIGVSALSKAVTVTNFGVIEGAGGTAVEFLAPSDTLVVEAGCAFLGAVNGGGQGILELGTGVGVLTGLLAGGGVTVSGSMATTHFTGFDRVTVDAPASFTAAGGGSIAAGQTLIVSGTLATGGTLAVAGSLIATGTLAGSGNLAVNGGTTVLNAGASLTIAKVTVAGAAGSVSIGAPSLAYAGKWTQKSGLLTVAAGDKISFTGTGDSFSGTLGGAGTIAFTGGADTLTAVSLSAASVTISGATVTLSGAITIAKAVTAASPALIVAAGGASLTGGGAFSLTNLATNKVIGATAAATLTNVNAKITGAGALGGGQMTLVNQTGAVIDGNVSSALTIDTGAATITNGGVIENTGAGGTTIKSAVANAGTLAVTAGILTVNGAVTGAGVVHIAGGTAFLAASFNQKVAFTGASGVLELAKSTAYTSSITGFSKTGSTSLDLNDITFTSGSTKASYSGTTAAGVLTVTDGTHTAHIHLTGNYTASTFVVASDGKGGTLVHDPARTTSPFIQAMAGFESAAGETWTVGERPRGAHGPLLAPRAHLA